MADNKVPPAAQGLAAKRRQPKFIIVMGKKGIGKTWLTLKLIDMYIKGDPATNTKPRKVLILDINGEYQQFKSIPVDYAFDPTNPDLKNWVLLFSSDVTPVEVRRVIPKKPDGSKMTIEEINVVLNYMLDNFYGGLLVVEDIARYVADSVSRDLTGALATQRHQNCDVICHFQWKSKALNPKLKGNVNEFRIHKTTDTFKQREQDLPGDPQMFYIAEQLEKYLNKVKLENATPEQLAAIEEIPVETACVYISIDRGKILGDFNREDFEKACLAYIAKYRRLALDELLNEMDLTSGKKKYTPAEAVKIKLDELMREYYGNED